VAVETITNPELHDGELLVISFEKRGEITMKARDLDGQDFRMQVGGLLDLRVENLRETNTIFDVVVYSGRDCPSKLIDFLCSNDLAWSRKTTEQLAGDAGRLLAITTVTGGKLVAHFKGNLVITPQA
jgi:hypothetical protein